MNTAMFPFEDFKLASLTIVEAVKVGVPYILLTGDSGAGKSSVFKYVKEVLDSYSFRFIYLHDQKLNLTGLVRVLARSLRLTVRRTNAETLQDMAAILSDEPGHTVLWLDEAHLIPDDTLSAVRSLVEARCGTASNISVVFCGLQALRHNLQAPHLFPIWRRLQRRIELIGLRSDEARPLLEHLVSKKESVRFKDDAVATLFDSSRGLPGLFVSYLDVINRQVPKGTIDADAVQNVIQQWDLE